MPAVGSEVAAVVIGYQQMNNGYQLRFSTCVRDVEQARSGHWVPPRRDPS